MLHQLMERQEDVKEMIATTRRIEDKTIGDALVGHLGYPDEVVTAAVLAAKEMTDDPDSEVTQNDLVWAGAYLDHLDTLGFTITRKS